MRVLSSYELRFDTMIYMFAALYCEASLFIRHFQLKKNPDNTRFAEFYNEAAGIRLTVTGVGEIAAAAAVSSVCTKYTPAPEDFLLNVGICARMSESGGVTAQDRPGQNCGDCENLIQERNRGVFLCNKIMEHATGKTFYPDLLYRHEFAEEMIVTGMRPWNGADIRSASDPPGTLYDMEAAAVYQTGSYFYGPHQMIFLKLVSDQGAEDAVSGEQVGHLMESYEEPLCAFIEMLREITAEYTRKAQGQYREPEALMKELCADLHCSKVMCDSLRQYIRYGSLTGTDVPAVIRGMYAEGLLTCRDKREGKQRLEELKRRLF